MHCVVLIAKQKRSRAKLVPRQKVQRQNVQRNKTLRDESPEGKYVWRQNVQRHNVWRRNICGTKVSRHNMSGRTQRPEDNTFGDKISLRTKRLEEKTSRDKASFWDILLVPILGIFYYSNEKICWTRRKNLPNQWFCSTYMEENPQKLHASPWLLTVQHGWATYYPPISCSTRSRSKEDKFALGCE
jgi:hypothetical protein